MAVVTIARMPRRSQRKFNQANTAPAESPFAQSIRRSVKASAAVANPTPSVKAAILLSTCSPGSSVPDLLSCPIISRKSSRPVTASYVNQAAGETKTTSNDGQPRPSAEPFIRQIAKKSSEDDCSHDCKRKLHRQGRLPRDIADSFLRLGQFWRLLRIVGHSKSYFSNR